MYSGVNCFDEFRVLFPLLGGRHRPADKGNHVSETSLNATECLILPNYGPVAAENRPLPSEKPSISRLFARIVQSAFADIFRRLLAPWRKTIAFPKPPAHIVDTG
jgi:hypothetical protein